ncbi:ArsR/SmtB family transcription factor [Vulgatibacter sp.]|uniref:ArsR/SmtB family transcription factor n=1 Tax=Vulgatibacter sp. TaxID=1971226 RepID=UPI00356154C3
MSKSRRGAGPRLVDAAPVFAALGDATRLRLLGRLAEGGPASIAALSEDAEVTRQAITKHLEVLARAGLVHGERSGRERIWALEARGLDAARIYLDRISAQWDEALGSLRDFVERER